MSENSSEPNNLSLLNDLSSKHFRFITKRDALPTEYLHFTLGNSTSDNNLILDESLMLSLFSPHGRVVGLIIKSGGRSGHAQFEFGHQAAKALNQWNGKSPFSENNQNGAKLLVTFAAIRTTPTQSTDNNEPRQINPLLENLRLWSRLLSDSDIESFTALTANVHKPEVSFGSPLEDEDDKFGLPAPKPLTTEIQSTMHQIVEKAANHNEIIENETENKNETNKIIDNSSSSQSQQSPLIYHPLSTKLINNNNSIPLFNRLTYHTLQPGGGIKPSIHDTNQFDSSFALISLYSGIFIDCYEINNIDRVHASIYLPMNSFLYIPSIISNQFLFGIAFRTRDIIDGKRYKRNKLTIIKLTRVRDLDEFDSVTLLTRELKLKEKEKFRHERENRRLISNSLPSELKSLSAELLEKLHVHKVYDAIAAHFSSTRHSPWPRVEAYVKSLSAGLSIIDVACGNGKYMGLNKTIKMTGCDISEPLVKICQSKGYNAMVADCLSLPFNNNEFDGCISIALLHHISNEERRIKTLSEMLRVVKPGGRILVTAWALEQDETSRRKFESQDVLVPWKLPNKFRQKPDHKDSDKNIISENNNETNNDSNINNNIVDDLTGECQRYCHVYVEGEIEGLLAKIGDNRVIEKFYDRGNWVVMFEKNQ